MLYLDCLMFTLSSLVKNITNGDRLLKTQVLQLSLSRLVFFLAVLAAGLPPDRAVPDSGRVLRSGPPPLPQQRLESDQDDNLLLRGGHQCDSCVPLGLHE